MRQTAGHRNHRANTHRASIAAGDRVSELSWPKATTKGQQQQQRRNSQ